MMIKLSDEEARLVLRALWDYAPEGDRPPDVEADRQRRDHIAHGIRARLEASPRPLDPPREIGVVPPAGAILPPHHRASHWRHPIPGIDR